MYLILLACLLNPEKMDDVLLFLFKKKAHLQPVPVTTIEIGETLGMSQQNASRRLQLLEKQGYVKRLRQGTRLTKKAINEISGLHLSLKKVFEEGELEIEGTVTKGRGEGGYYLKLEGYRKQMRKKLGFEPYPGTLNIKLSNLKKREQLLRLEPVVITGFKENDRAYGDLFAYKCRLEGHDCAILIPLRTHHGPKILEIVCPFNIRKQLEKRDGDRIRVIVW
ncbi:DUF120 domain-containing protein [Candidatus Micrarchaeota archaeon]|nr:DUF120 domain-containing protein [Candidatus Micrarchaeota archaeon]